jgi:predicted Zn-dependent protease
MKVGTLRTKISSMAAIVAVIAIVSLSVSLASAPARAAGIRDAEIEHTIRTYASPLLRAAEIEQRDFGLHIVNDKALNAFVARGQRIFITSGLLMSAERPGQVIGVLAHEIGHITGGHLARLEGALDDARSQALIGQIIGLALGVLAKDAGVAAAGTAAGTGVAVKNLLKYSRIQEQSADQLAVNLLDQTQTSARGLLEFFELLQDQELLVRARQDDYVVTHPLTQNRIGFVRNHVAKSPYSDKKLPTILQAMHDRMVAKLKGFINPPSRTLFEFKADDPSVMARYARAVAYFRDARIAQALPLIDGLIADAPGDAYFHELKGQMLFENGRIKEALPSYQKAVDLQPGQPLLRVGLAHAQIELNQPDLISVALRNLEQAIRYDRFMPLSWRLAATAYGRSGDIGMSALALAEQNLLLGRNLDAAGQAKKAQRLLKDNSPSWLRAQDIANTADRARRKKNDR